MGHAIQVFATVFRGKSGAMGYNELGTISGCKHFISANRIIDRQKVCSIPVNRMTGGHCAAHHPHRGDGPKP